MQFEIKHIIKALKAGKTILYPTDTIWGIGCDVFNEAAVEHIYKIKKRDRNKPLIILVSDIDMLKTYVPHIHPRIETLLFFHMRPITVIYNDPINLPQWMLANDNSIAIRLVKDSLIKEVIKEYQNPIVSTSANIQGDPSPDYFEGISKKLKKAIDYIVPKEFEDKVNKPASVIIRYDRDGNIELVR